MEPHGIAYDTGAGVWCVQLNLPPTVTDILHAEATEYGPVHTIIVLDVSGSMGNSVPRLIKTLLPDALERAGMLPNDTVHLIPFNSSAAFLTTTPHLMRANKTVASGGTNLSPAISVLSDLMDRLSGQDKLRGGQHVVSRFHVLAVSDGDISDTEQTMAAAVSLRAALLNAHWRVNAQAIRFLSSTYANPDTRALASVLQWNTESLATMIDASCSSTDTALLAQLDTVTGFRGRDFVVTTTDGSDEEALNVFLPLPWSNTESGNKQFIVHWPTQRLHENLTVTFWMSASGWSPEMGPLYLNHRISVPVTVMPLTSAAYERVLSKSRETLLTTAALLRMVGHRDTLAELQQMVPFFQAMERAVQPDPVDAEEDPAEARRHDVILHRRMMELRKRMQKSQSTLSLLLNQIANEDRMDNFNSQQKAEYLRSVGANHKTAKGLVRRAGTSGEPDDIARGEAAAIAIHLPALEATLAGDAEGELAVSFINQGNVLDGLRVIAELVQAQLEDASVTLSAESDVEDVAAELTGLTAIDLLELLNLVGIPAVSRRVGDYPDPYLYRFDHLYHGFFLSLSDCISFDRLSVRTANPIDGSDEPRVLGWRGVSIPGVAGGEVSDVVTVIEHPAIGAFLRRHAPQLWNLTAGVGMRRVLACVPQTAAAATAAGLTCAIRGFHEGDGSSVALRSVRMLAVTALQSRSVSSMKEEMRLIVSADTTPADRLCCVEQQPTEARWLIPLLAALQQLHTHRLEAAAPAQAAAAGPWWETTLTGRAALPAPAQKFLRSWLAYNVFRRVQQHFRSSGGDGEAAKLVQAHLTELLGVTAEVAEAMQTEWPREALFTFALPEKVTLPEETASVAPAQPVISGPADVLDALGLVVMEGSRVVVGHTATLIQDLYNRTKVLVDELTVQVVYVWLAADMADCDEEAAVAAAQSVRAHAQAAPDAFHARVLDRFFGIRTPAASTVLPAGSPVPPETAMRLETHLATLALALLYPTMESRLAAVEGAAEEDESKTSTIPDFAELAVVRALLAEKRSAVVAKAHQRTVLAKHKAEQSYLTKQLLSRLCALPMAEAAPYWENGLYYMPDLTMASQPPSEAQQAQCAAAQKRAFYHAQLKEPNAAAGRLGQALVSGTYQEDTDAAVVVVSDVPEKIAALLTGRLFPPLATLKGSAQEVVAADLPVLWNNGNNWMGIKLDAFREAVAARSPLGIEGWQLVLMAYNSQRKHNYGHNGEPNRHTHSANKPSYFAMGYGTVEEYAAAVSAEEWARYCAEHTMCCGLEGYTPAENVRRQQELVQEREAVHQQSRVNKRASRDARNERKKRRREQEAQQQPGAGKRSRHS